MKELWRIADFVHGIRTQLRFGKFSRAELRLLRFELQADKVKCDWLSRPPDAWDLNLPRHARDRSVSSQALQDAMTLRKMIFELLPEVRTAELRAFRQSAREPPALIIAGIVTRDAPAVHKVTSPVMRAKLYGFQFWMEDGVLKPLETEDRNLEFATSA
jgi:hypothetical protein